METNLITPLKIWAKENGVAGQQFQVLKSTNAGKETRFIPTPAGTLFIGKKTDMSKLKFVIVNDGSQNAELAGSLWITNANVEVVMLTDLV